MKTTSLVSIPLVSILLLTDLLFAIRLTAQQTFTPAHDNQSDPSAEPITMPLWEGKAPGALGDSDLPENSVAFYLELHKAGVPAEMHIFENAPHGVGLDLADPAVGEWARLLIHWLRERNVLPR